MYDSQVYLPYRIRAVQFLDQKFYERGNTQRCHINLWKKPICCIFGISSSTYRNYLRCDPDKLPELPKEAVEILQIMADSLLHHGTGIK